MLNPLNVSRHYKTCVKLRRNTPNCSKSNAIIFIVKSISPQYTDIADCYDLSSDHSAIICPLRSSII